MLKTSHNQNLQYYTPHCLWNVVGFCLPVIFTCLYVILSVEMLLMQQFDLVLLQWLCGVCNRANLCQSGQCPGSLWQPPFTPASCHQGTHCI